MTSHLKGDGADELRRSSSATPECSFPTGASSPSNAYAGLTLNGDKDREMTSADGDGDRDGDRNGSSPMVADGASQASQAPGTSSSQEPSHQPVRSASPAIKRPASELDDQAVPAGISISITKGKSTTVQNVAAKESASGSRNASPAPSATGMVTRGRARRNGRTLGTCGLSNLGNTCYMNSALQCVRSVEELTQYFRLDKFKGDLNPTNRLAYNGEVARSYAHLLGHIYAASCPASVSPRAFKQTIGRHRPSFSGFGQQDSQEFLGFLLDGLQEDLYRIQEKPSFEIPDSTDEMVQDPAALQAFADRCWELYQARNDSVIVDLFAGTYKSTLVCPTCHKVSITFDPFNNLTLQLPVDTTWSREVIFMPWDGRPIRVMVDMDKNSSIRMLKEFVGARVHVEVERLFAAEVYKNRIYKAYEDFDCVSEIIQSGDRVFVYELEVVPTNWPTPKKDPPTGARPAGFVSSQSEEEGETPRGTSPLAEKLLVPVLHRLPPATASRFPSLSVVDLPFYIILTHQDANDYDAILKKILARLATLTTRDIFADDAGDGFTTPEEDVVVVASTEDTDSSDARMKTHSVESEEDLVAVDMKDGRGPSQMDSSTEPSAPPPRPSQMDSSTEPSAPPPHPPRPRPRRPKVLEPGSFIPGELQRMFQVRVFKDAGDLLPVGWSSSLENNRDFPLVQARIPTMGSRSSPERGVDGSPPSSPGTSSDSDSMQHSHEYPNRSFVVPEGDSDSDHMPERLPPIRKILAHRYGPKSRHMGRMSKKGHRNGARAKYAYARKRVESEAASVDVTTPGPLIRLGEGILLDWDPAAYASLFHGRNESDLRGMPTWEHAERLGDEELERKQALRANRQNKGLSLEDCLDEFDKEEILSENNAWYCPKCKAFRRASKKLELWKAPDILIIHLKRFSASRVLRDKLEVRVDFPIEGLDLTKRVAMKEEGKETMYDLIAVDNHYGGLGGGHYTAIARNFNDGEWYDYNDTMTSKRSPQQAVTNAAYLLFYRRRSTRPLGGPFFERMMDERMMEERPEQVSPATSSRSSSPAGDEQRFGDSSRAGLSNESPEAGVGTGTGTGRDESRQVAATTAAVATASSASGPQQPEGVATTEREHAEDELPGYASLYPGAAAGPPALNLGPSATTGTDCMDLDEGIDTSYNGEQPVASSAAVALATGTLLSGIPSWGFDHLHTAADARTSAHDDTATAGGAAAGSSDEDLMDGASDKADDGSSNGNVSDIDNRMAQFEGMDDDDDHDLDIDVEGRQFFSYRNDEYAADDDVDDVLPPPSAARSSPVTNIALDPHTQKLYLHSTTRGGSDDDGGVGGGFLTSTDDVEDIAEEVRISGGDDDDDGDDADEDKVAEVRVGLDEDENEDEGK